MDAPYIPYCGSPPVPGALAWNADPVLAAALVGAALVYVLAGRRPGGPGRREQALFFAGWGVTVAALMSPLCNLSVALFSARVAQHVILLLIAAPLIALGRPDKVVAVLRGRVRPGPGSRHGGVGVAATALFAVALWTWHLPGPYDATLRSDFVYWTMHVTTFGAALALWHVLLAGGRDGSAVAISVLASLVTAIQMSLLGALLSLAPRPLFDVHSVTTWPWGLSPLEDQQLGGLIMWVLGGLLFTLYFAVAFAAWLHGLERGQTGGPSVAG
ncbi:cytochrome c oxidase assembly protein [Xanthobacteraceae bacterium Astr-EGSB]|uniref:cytochrome c oxidase assembly protein n=1 Tax=Astrobacterium formosum TaxID=3069710 RepID=UPI0027B34356|nr:cytochrome c oxidase assembly protein [Xanthobacteraceae bacterium Astr-EGSB]